jgi:uncharacterized membrane protein YphA (DoxX/SURF4 family)
MMRFLPRVGPAELLLRFALGFSFIYPPVDAAMHPDDWVGYFPTFLMDLIVKIGILPHVLLHAFGVLELALAAWILFGRSARVPALVAAGTLVAIVAMNGPQFPVLFRDVSIAVGAIALALLSKPKPVRA